MDMNKTTDMNVQKLYYTTATFLTHSKGQIECPLKFLGGSALSDSEFETYASAKLDELDRLLSEKKELELVDVNGNRVVLRNEDVYWLNVSTVETKRALGKSPRKGRRVIEFNTGIR